MQNSTLISLVGEQPIPLLIPYKHLNIKNHILVFTETTVKVASRLEKMLNAQKLKISDPYSLERILADLNKELDKKSLDASDFIFNLTGGTKIMAIATYAFVSLKNSKFVYYQSENNQNRLFTYKFKDGLPSLHQSETLTNELITIDDYLNAHLLGYEVEGFSTEEGGKFEEAIYDILKKDGFEVVSGVRPKGVEDQIEIDLVIRAGNRVGIAEIKIGDKDGKSPKKGLDQLAMAGGREYLGTYTTKFLITGRKPSKQISTLATERGITVVSVDYDPRNKITKESQERIRKEFRAKLNAPWKNK
jgi:hypothetical protein